MTCSFLEFQCYYIGGLEESATGTLGELSKPISYHMPSDKICEKIKKKDSQICELKFGNYRQPGIQYIFDKKNWDTKAFKELSNFILEFMCYTYILT